MRKISGGASYQICIPHAVHSEPAYKIRRTASQISGINNGSSAGLICIEFGGKAGLELVGCDRLKRSRRGRQTQVRSGTGNPGVTGIMHRNTGSTRISAGGAQASTRSRPKRERVKQTGSIGIQLVDENPITAGQVSGNIAQGVSVTSPVHGKIFNSHISQIGGINQRLAGLIEL